MEPTTENYDAFSNLYKSLTILEKEYLRKLHAAKQEEIANQLAQNKEDRSYEKATAQKEFEKQLPFDMTLRVNEMYADYVVQHTQGSTENLLASENLSKFLDQLDLDPEMIDRPEKADEENKEQEFNIRYQPYIRADSSKPIKHVVNVHTAQGKWLDRYVELGNQQLDIVQHEQQYLERNLFSRLWNRKQISDNRKYLANLSSAVKDIEWQKSSYLHNSIEITAQSALENELAQQFTEKINEHYQSRIDQLTSSVTLENYESSTEQYNHIKSELFSLEQWRFKKNTSFPSFGKTVDQLHLLDIDVSKINEDVKTYLSNVKAAASQGRDQLNKDQLEILDSMNIESLMQTNEILDKCTNDYVKSVESFVKGFDKDGQLTNLAIDNVKNYQIDAEYIKNRQDQVLQKEFDQFYISCSDREKDYFHALNNVNLEVRDNLDIVDDNEKSHVYKEYLETHFDDLSGDQIESLHVAYNKFIDSGSTTLNQKTFNEYAKELNLIYDTNYKNVNNPSLDPYEQQYLQENLSELEKNYIKESQEQKPDLSLEQEPHYSQEAIDQMEMSYSDIEDNSTRDDQTVNDISESSLSLAERELAAALETGDIKKIAEARSKVNTAKMDQMMSQSFIIEQQKQKEIKQQEEQEAKYLEDLEKAIDIYSDYLTNGKVTNEDLRFLVAFDEKISDFDKVSYRLEAVERVQEKHPEISLDNFRSLLESIDLESGDLSSILESEYYEMSTTPRQSRDQLMVAEETAELILE